MPVNGVGKVWFRAMTDSRLRPDSKFAHFAALTIDWATREYPHLKAAVIKGWERVQVTPYAISDYEEPPTPVVTDESSHVPEYFDHDDDEGSGQKMYGLGFSAKDNDGRVGVLRLMIVIIVSRNGKINEVLMNCILIYCDVCVAHGYILRTSIEMRECCVAD